MTREGDVVDKLEQIAEDLRVGLNGLTAEIDRFEKEIQGKIEETKNDAMRSAVEELSASVNRRLTAIEQQLATMKEEE